MDANRIDIKTLCLSLIAILSSEIAIRPLIPGNPIGAITLIGVVRIFQTLLQLWIVGHIGKGLQNIGLLPSRILSGFKRGVIWSVGFGGVVLIIFTIMAIMGVRPFDFFTVSLPANGLHVLLLFCIGGVVGPVAEEVFFRGVLYGYMRQWGVIIAILISTSIFVMVHSSSTQVPLPQIVGGIIFALAYEIEKNLMAPITIHIAGNLAIYTLSLLF